MFFMQETSQNAKLGMFCATVSTKRETCPTTCSMASICYASKGAYRITRDKRERQSTLSVADVARKLTALPYGYAVRLFPSEGDLPNSAMVLQQMLQCWNPIIKTRKLRVFGFTHKWEGNLTFLKEAWDTLHIRASIQADESYNRDSSLLRAVGIPFAVVVPTDFPNTVQTDGNANKVFLCPQQTNKNVVCATCNLCAISRIQIAFRLHGSPNIKKQLTEFEKALLFIGEKS